MPAGYCACVGSTRATSASAAALIRSFVGREKAENDVETRHDPYEEYLYLTYQVFPSFDSFEASKGSLALSRTHFPALRLGLTSTFASRFSRGSFSPHVSAACLAAGLDGQARFQRFSCFLSPRSPHFTQRLSSSPGVQRRCPFSSWQGISSTSARPCPPPARVPANSLRRAALASSAPAGRTRPFRKADGLTNTIFRCLSLPQALFISF